MTGVNKVILVGNLGKKPDLRYTSSGVPFATFTLATTEKWGTDEQGNKKEHTEWHRITAWRKLGEICAQYLDKGSKVFVEGRIRRGEYTGQDGVKRFSYDIHIDEMVMLSPKGAREFVPEESSWQEYPDTSGAPARKAAAPKSDNGSDLPAPPNNVDLDDDMDLNEDQEFID